MRESDAFLTIAEFSIALAGFTSVVVVFARQGGRFSAVDRFRVQNALWTSLGPAVIAFCPFAFGLFDFSATAVWRASSAVFSAYLAVFFLVARSATAALGDSDRAVLGGGGRQVLVVSGVLVNLLLQPLNATGVLFSPHPGIFFIGLILVLLTSITIFVRIVFVRPSTGSTNNGE